MSKQTENMMEKGRIKIVLLIKLVKINKNYGME